MKVFVFGFLALSVVFSSAAYAADGQTKCIHFNGKTICDDGSSVGEADSAEAVVPESAPAPPVVLAGPVPGDTRTRCRGYSNGRDCWTEEYLCWSPRLYENRCQWRRPDAFAYRRLYIAPILPLFGFAYRSDHHHYRHHR